MLTSVIPSRFDIDELVQTGCQRQLTADELSKLDSMLEKAGTNIIMRSMSDFLFVGGQAVQYNLRMLPRFRVRYADTMFKTRKQLIRKDQIRKTQRRTHSNVQIVVTDHAAERYVKRIDQSISKQDAKNIISHSFQNARLEKDKTLLGHEKWVIDSGAVLVIKRDKGRGNPPVCVTVLLDVNSEDEATLQQPF